MINYKSSTPSVQKTMLWTDNGFENVEDKRLLEKRIKEIEMISNFRIGDGRVYRTTSELWDESVYMHYNPDYKTCVGELGTRRYKGKYSDCFYIPKDQVCSVFYKDMIFIYRSKKEMEMDEENRSNYKKEFSFKTKDMCNYIKEIEDIKINGVYKNLTTYYVYDNDPIRIWFWIEDNTVYYYSKDNIIDNLFEKELMGLNLRNVRECK